MSIENAYNSWAEHYDSNDNKTRDLDACVTVETLSNYDFSQVLELGCGTGKNTVWLLPRTQRIVGLDFSDNMLAIAREKVQDPKVEFRQTDLTQPWPVDPNSFDLVTSSLTLEHIEDLDHVFRQAHHHLVDGGLFFISELHPFKQYSGSGARFESDGGTVHLEAFTHHLSEFVTIAIDHGFELLELKEWFDDGDERNMPRLVSMVFRKRVDGASGL